MLSDLHVFIIDWFSLKASLIFGEAQSIWSLFPPSEVKGLVSAAFKELQKALSGFMVRHEAFYALASAGAPITSSCFLSLMILGGRMECADKPSDWGLQFK